VAAKENAGSGVTGMFVQRNRKNISQAGDGDQGQPVGPVYMHRIF
jgi:hypothetical protein